MEEIICFLRFSLSSLTVRHFVQYPGPSAQFPSVDTVCLRARLAASREISVPLQIAIYILCRSSNPSANLHPDIFHKETI